MSPTEPPLFLGPNQIYRADIQFAAARTRFDPAALAALINAEAAKRNGVWDANSAAGSSSAVGLTQFLVDSWEEMAATPGTYLNEVGKRKGLIDSDNYFFEDKEAQLLDLRRDPRLSITTAAEYAQINLKAIAKAGFVSSGEENAKRAYLAHHEGAPGAIKILKGTNTEKRAEHLLKAQFTKGSDQPQRLHSAHGTWRRAYEVWLLDYIDKHIKPDQFRHPVQPVLKRKQSTGTRSPERQARSLPNQNLNTIVTRSRSFRAP